MVIYEKSIAAFKLLAGRLINATPGVDITESIVVTSPQELSNLADLNTSGPVATVTIDPRLFGIRFYGQENSFVYQLAVGFPVRFNWAGTRDLKRESASDNLEMKLLFDKAYVLQVTPAIPLPAAKSNAALPETLLEQLRQGMNDGKTNGFAISTPLEQKHHEVVINGTKQFGLYMLSQSFYDGLAERLNSKLPQETVSV